MPEVHVKLTCSFMKVSTLELSSDDYDTPVCLFACSEMTLGS